MGHMSARGRVMRHIAIIMHRSRWGTGVMGYMGDVWAIGHMSNGVHECKGQGDEAHCHYNA